jgi:hypothetical protein
LLTDPGPQPLPIPKELQKCDKDDWSCEKRIREYALREAKNSGLPGLTDGPADAYRHCLWSCKMARECSSGTVFSMCVGAGHEAEQIARNKESGGAFYMDTHNNCQGIKYANSGSDKSCDTLCMEGVHNGDLQCSAK